jgi:hypothetical protein
MARPPMEEDVYYDNSQQGIPMDMGYQTGIPQQQQDPNAIYADWMKEGKVANIIEQLDPDTLLIDIERRVRGYKKDMFTKQWLKPKQQQINEMCIVRFMSFLGAVLNKNTTFSNFNEMEVNNLMFLIIEYVADDLEANSDEYGLTNNYTEMSRIGNIICLSVFCCLKRAVNGMEARRFFESLSLKGEVSPEQKKKGFMDALKFWQ